MSDRKPYGKLRPGSDEWVREHFPEYIYDGKPIVLKRKWGFISGRRHTKETSPWAFAPNVADGKTPNIWGKIVKRVRDSKPPYYKDTVKYLSEEQYLVYLDTLNYFRNGGKGVNGKDGLNPQELIDGTCGLSPPYVCKGGRYWPSIGGQALFLFNDKRKKPWRG